MGGGGFCTPCAQAIFPSLRTLTNEAKRTLDMTRELLRHKPLVINVVVMSQFEEEEEGTGVASDVVKVQGEDPTTPGPLI